MRVFFFVQRTTDVVRTRLLSAAPVQILLGTLSYGRADAQTALCWAHWGLCRSPHGPGGAHGGLSQKQIAENELYGNYSIPSVRHVAGKHDLQHDEVALKREQ